MPELRCNRSSAIAAPCAIIEIRIEPTGSLHARPPDASEYGQLVTRDWIESYGRGGGVARALGVGPVLGVGVGLGVVVGVAVAVAAGVALGVIAAVGVAV